MKINPNILRKKVIEMVMAKKSGHIGGAFSMAELTSVLYEDFDIGGSPMNHAGDPKGGAKNVVNCRCVIVYADERDIVL